MSATLVEMIKKHALLNYENYGWSEVVECYSDNDISDVIKDAATFNQAVDRMQEIVDARNERWREAVGPDIECLTCGKKFPENTVCPKCR